MKQISFGNNEKIRLFSFNLGVSLLKKNKMALVAFLYIAIISAAANALGIVGDYVEQMIGFISPLLMFVVVAVLLAQWQGMELFNKKVRLALAVLLLIITIIEYVYPMLAYSEQTFSPNHTTLLFVEFSINAVIARILIK